MAKAFFTKHNIPFVEIDVEKDKQAAKEMVDLSGQYGVPVIAIGNDVIVGFNIDELNKSLGTRDAGHEFDILIIGAGPAGLTAAMYCARKSLNTLIVGEDIGGQALWSWSIDNYMGYRMITGEDLMKKFEEQVQDQFIHFELDRVVSLNQSNGLFLAQTASGKVFRTKGMIIATGKRPRTLGIKGEDFYMGRGVSVCSTCDGPLYRGKNIAVVGGGNSALQTAIEMSGIASHVHLIVRSTIKADEAYLKNYRNKDNITTHLNTEITALSGEPFLKAITIRDRVTGVEAQVDIDGVFLEIGLLPNTEFLGNFVKLNENKEIVVDLNCHTDVPGVFACGDVTSVKGKQIIIAAGEGAKAALEAYEYIMKT